MTVQLEEPALARAFCAEQLAARRTIGFVPTMGALHPGHLSLVAAAHRECDVVVVSVFVNPLQFNDPKDFELYPRDFARDAELLGDTGCDLVFTGTLQSFFPESRGDPERIAWREPGPAARGLEGDRRPGHFRGVTTIVARLFELVAPTRAYFGAKDFQQTLVVRELARELGAPTIVTCATARETNGLARSSRNELLSRADRERAAAIYRGLRGARAAWRDGARASAELRRPITEALERASIELDYAELRDPEAWSAAEPTRALERAIALVAARVGGVRLIDNLRLDVDGDGA